MSQPGSYHEGVARLLKRIDWEKVQQIAHYLLENQKIGKTKLSFMCGMNYALCIKYLEWMDLVGLVTMDGPVMLTERGHSIFDPKTVRTGADSRPAAAPAAMQSFTD